VTGWQRIIWNCYRCDRKKTTADFGAGSGGAAGFDWLTSISGKFPLFRFLLLGAGVFSKRLIPEVLPTGVVLEAVAEALVSNGHQVTVLCGKSSSTGEGAHAPPRVPPGAPPGDAAMEMGKWGNLKMGKWGSPNPRDSSSSQVQVVRLWAPGWGKRKSALGKILLHMLWQFGVAALLLQHGGRNWKPHRLQRCLRQKFR
jgi:hypothetical protein